MKTIKIISTAILLTGLVLLTSCKRNAGEVAAEEHEILPEDVVEMRKDQAELASIRFGQVEKQTIPGTLRANGIVTVAPQNQATVYAPMGGIISSANVLPGNQVKKGQVLVQLENQEFIDLQQNFLEAKNRLEFAEAEYNRHADLFKEDVYSKQNMQEVTVNFKSLKAQVKALQEKLLLVGINPDGLDENSISRFLPLRSPINGYIKSTSVNTGKFVNTSELLFEIVNTDGLILELTLFEKDADKVVAGQKLSFFINDEQEEHKAVILQTGKTITADKTYKVFARVTDDCRNILPGMYVNADIEISRREVHALPTEAIVSFNDRYYIFAWLREKDEDGKQVTEFTMLEIRKGVTANGYTEVILPPDFDYKNSRVVVKGAYNLLCAKKNAGEMSC
jgi:cobalt-zinc-cadmium efflux system membrane fusion protein